MKLKTTRANQARRIGNATAKCTSAVVMLGIASAPAFGQRVLGIDVSAWQGNMSQTTWNGLHNNDARDFVFIRASRGGTTGYDKRAGGYPSNDDTTFNLSQRYDDPYYVQNINRATTAGMFAGSYHFSRPDVITTTQNSGGIANNGTDEANHFIQRAGPFMRPGYLLPVHDLEAGDGIRSDTELAQFTMDFSNRIFAVMGIRPAIYLNGNYAANILAESTNPTPASIVAAHPVLWTARWPAGSGDVYQGNIQTEQPKDTYSPIYGPWDDTGVTHPWSFWQYSSGERLSSFGARLDANVANGGIEFVKDKLVPAVWMNNSNGDWATLANWNSGQAPVAPVQMPNMLTPVGTQTLPTPRLPGAAGSGVTAGMHDTVTLDRAGVNITVTHSTGATNIRKLYLDETLNITGGSFNVNYVPSADSTPYSVDVGVGDILGVSGSATVSAHTLYFDVGAKLNLNGGTTSFRQLTLQGIGPQAVSAAIVMGGDATLAPLVASETAVISTTTGQGVFPGSLNLGGATRTLTISNASVSPDVSIQVPIVNGGLTKVGTGNLELTGANTYTGPTTINEGVVTATGASSLGAASGSLTVNNLHAGGSPAGGGTTVTLNLSTTAATTKGSLAGTIVNTSGGNFLRINNGGQLFTINQTTDATFMGIIAGAGGFRLGSASTAALTMANANTYTGGTTVDGGTLIAASTRALSVNFVTINNGATVRAKPGLVGPLNVFHLNTTGSGQLDLTNNAMLVTNSTTSAVRSLVVSGFAAGAWNGPGINSSIAAADFANGDKVLALGYVATSQLPAGTTSFAGITGLDANDVIVKQTYYGDANLGGTVDLDDFTQLLAGLAGDGTGWLYGDFDYNGSINLDDFTQFLAGFDAQGSGLSELTETVDASSLSASQRQAMLGAIAAVPEPGCVALLGVAAVALRRRRGLTTRCGR